MIRGGKGETGVHKENGWCGKKSKDIDLFVSEKVLARGMVSPFVDTPICDLHQTSFISGVGGSDHYQWVTPGNQGGGDGLPHAGGGDGDFWAWFFWDMGAWGETPGAGSGKIKGGDEGW